VFLPRDGKLDQHPGSPGGRKQRPHSINPITFIFLFIGRGPVDDIENARRVTTAGNVTGFMCLTAIPVSMARLLAVFVKFTVGRTVFLLTTFYIYNVFGTSRNLTMLNVYISHTEWPGI
jgi:hypothetical protein